METNVFTAAWEDFQTRLGEEVKLIPRNEQVSTLYQNISMLEPRLVVQFERVIMNFTREIKQHSTELENLALAVKRAQDISAMQLSEMEEDMDERVQAAEKKMLLQETKRGEAALNELRRHYESEVCELQHKLQKMQVIEEQYKRVNMKDESPALKRRINELLLENQQLKQELMQLQTNMACLQSELDTLKTEMMDRSINCEQDEALMRQFSDERGTLERQIQVLQAANRKLHDSNDGLRSALENSFSKSTKGGSNVLPVSTLSRSKSICYSTPLAMMDRFLQPCMDEDLLNSGGRRPSCDSLALAICDPMHHHPSHGYEDSLHETFLDSGLLAWSRSNTGYDSEQEAKVHGEEEHTEEGKREEEKNMDTKAGENSDMAEMPMESPFGSENSFVLDWKPSESINQISAWTFTSSKPLTSEENKKDSKDLGYMTSERAHRIVLAGDAAVGKSSFLLRFCKNKFWEFSNSTLGVDFEIKTIIVDGEPTVLQLWDTAGQERFRSIAKSYFRRADGVLLVYDVTCEKSFLNVREWVDMIEDVSQEDIPIMLLGNKCDLRQQALQDGIPCIPTSYGEKLAMTYNALFCETSAKNGSNVNEAVMRLAREVIKQVHEDENQDSVASLSRTLGKKITNLTCCTG